MQSGGTSARRPGRTIKSRIHEMSGNKRRGRWNKRMRKRKGREREREKERRENYMVYRSG